MTTKELDRIFEALGGRDRLEEDRNEYEKSFKFLQENWERLVRQYPNRWVAALQSEIVAADVDFENLMRALKRKGVPIGRVAIDFVGKEERLMLL
jgi:hypothetical protein